MYALAMGKLTTGGGHSCVTQLGNQEDGEDTHGHEQCANQIREDTRGAAGILKDTSLRRFGTVRPQP
jgi:hypothetical protein